MLCREVKRRKDYQETDAKDENSAGEHITKRLNAASSSITSISHPFEAIASLQPSEPGTRPPSPKRDLMSELRTMTPKFDLSVQYRPAELLKATQQLRQS